MFNFYDFYLGPGQSIEQAIAQPVIRMQPVMQQTNVIHVGQGGTVIFPTGQQVNQVRPTQNAMSNQATSFSSRKFQFFPKKKISNFTKKCLKKLVQQQNQQFTAPAGNTYTFVQSQPYQMQQQYRQMPPQDSFLKF